LDAVAVTSLGSFALDFDVSAAGLVFLLAGSAAVFAPVFFPLLLPAMTLKFELLLLNICDALTPIFQMETRRFKIRSSRKYAKKMKNDHIRELKLKTIGNITSASFQDTVPPPTKMIFKFARRFKIQFISHLPPLYGFPI
jgi:hypothetical protein